MLGKKKILLFFNIYYYLQNIRYFQLPENFYGNKVVVGKLNSIFRFEKEDYLLVEDIKQPLQKFRYDNYNYNLIR